MGTGRDVPNDGKTGVPKTILTVDDSSFIRKLLRMALSGQGFLVAEAEDGVAALEWLDTHDRPDVMITDINMPRLDGFGLVAAVRAQDRHHGMPILVLSTESSADKQDRARTAGADGWLVKPFDPAQLASAIESVSP
jgi:two-component system chemotaxis response regulator CheY